MTLTPFSPEALDELSLRLLDVAAAVRTMATKSRENGLVDFQLHGQKACEWLANLEQWAHESTVRMERQVIRLRGARRGQGVVPTQLKPRPRKADAGRKKAN